MISKNHTDLLMKKTCSFCGGVLPPQTVYFCRQHWFEIPAKARSELYAMHVRKEDTRSKVQQCVRILGEQGRNRISVPRGTILITE